MFDPTKPVRLSDGRAARIVFTGGNFSCNRSIIAVANPLFEGEFEQVYVFSDDGKSLTSGLYLVNIPEPIHREVWVNVYKKDVYGVFESAEKACLFGCKDRLACVKVVIDCNEGDGL